MQAEKVQDKVTFDFMVDGEPYQTHDHVLTATQILQIAGKDPANYYLVEIHGKQQESYKDKPNEPIHMHEHAKFVSVFKGSTPVS